MALSPSSLGILERCGPGVVETPTCGRPTQVCSLMFSCRVCFYWFLFDYSCKAAPGAGLFSETSCWWPPALFVCIARSFAGPGGLVSPRAEGQGRAGCSAGAGGGAVPLGGAWGGSGYGGGRMLRGAGCSALDLGQVGGQIVGGPAVPGPEGLRFGGLGVPHDAGPVLVGVDA